MIIYQALSTYQILECIEHKQIYHREEHAMLILGTYIVEKFPEYKKIVRAGFFDDVCLFNFGGVEVEEKKILEVMEERIKNTLPIHPREAEKIYIAGVHTYLAMYLISKGIHFSMFEDGSGALSRPWVLAEITKKSSPAKYEIINHYGLYTHTSELIEEKWCNENAQVENFFDEKMKHFDVLDGFELLTSDEKNKILDFFGIKEKIDLEEDSTLLLTQQFSNLGQLSFEDHVRIYQYLFDFYFNEDMNRVVMKLHPDDIMYYEKLFPKVRLVKNLFPSELLPFVFTRIPKKIATITSTGVHLIKDRFAEVLQFNEMYERTFKYDPYYYVVLQFVKYLGEKELDVYGGNILQLQNMIKTNCKTLGDLQIYQWENEGKKGKILLVDDFCEKSLEDTVEDNYLMIIYMNSLKKYNMYCNYQRDKFMELIPLDIFIDSYKECENDIENRASTVWIQTKNEGMKKRMGSFKLNHDLKNTEKKLSVKLYEKEQLEIMRLRGLLEATEKRLKDYIDREQVLLEKLKKMEE